MRDNKRYVLENVGMILLSDMPAFFRNVQNKGMLFSLIEKGLVEEMQIIKHRSSLLLQYEYLYKLILMAAVS